MTYALIEIADPASTAAGLTSPSLRTQRAALLALDQMPGGGLQAATVVALLESPDAEMRDTAWRVVARHQDWGDALAGYFQQRMAKARPERRGSGSSCSRSWRSLAATRPFSSSLARL